MESSEQHAQTVQKIFADRIDEPPQAMRQEIDRDTLWDLKESIEKRGLINPITVRPIGDRFQVVAGHRRFLACRMAGVLNISCVVRDLTDEQVFAIMTEENLKRVDVDPVAEGVHFLRAIEQFGKTAKQVADEIGRSESYVESRLVVARMSDYMQAFIKSGELKLGVALHLFDIEPEDKRRLWVGVAIDQNITVRTAEYWAYQHKLGTLPMVVNNDTDIPNGPVIERRVPTFNCELTGEVHPLDDLRLVSIAIQHIDAFNEFASALRIELAKTESPPIENALPVPVGNG